MATTASIVIRDHLNPTTGGGWAVIHVAHCEHLRVDTHRVAATLPAGWTVSTAYAGHATADQAERYFRRHCPSPVDVRRCDCVTTHEPTLPHDFHTADFEDGE